MLKAYRILTALFTPLIVLWIYERMRRGKEDRKRIGERFGKTRVKRPKGTLLWLHAASVGEANSVLLFIGELKKSYPELHILLTTGTVTSARLMTTRLPAGVIHQYAPVDMPAATRRFIWHWRPNIALWVESELWPNLICEADYFNSFMGIINARMSEKSFRGWNKYPGFIRPLIARFDVIFAQSDADALRLNKLGGKDVLSVGNLKYDAAPLPCNEDQLIAMKTAVGTRPVWLAASTHPGEEEQIAEAHRLLAAARPDLLTVVAPRHPARGPDIAAMLGKTGRVALRSRREMPQPGTAFYIADTLGELGLFYRLSEIVFMGGSLVHHGGQNPLEPARLSCAIVTGPHTHNFSEIMADMEKSGGLVRAENAAQLAARVDTLLNNASARDAMQHAVRGWLKTKTGGAARMLAELAPVLTPRRKGAPA